MKLSSIQTSGFILFELLIAFIFTTLIVTSLFILKLLSVQYIQDTEKIAQFKHEINNFNQSILSYNNITIKVINSNVNELQHYFSKKNLNVEVKISQIKQRVVIDFFLNEQRVKSSMQSIWYILSALENANSGWLFFPRSILKILAISTDITAIFTALLEKNSYAITSHFQVR